MFIFKTHRHIHAFSTSCATSVSVQGLPKWESHNNSVNSLCRESPTGFMNRPAITLDSNFYTSLLQTCTHITSLNQLHAHILITGLQQNVFLGTKLVSMYAICGSLENARLVFDRLYKPNVFSWNAIIRGYARAGLCEETLALYHQMQQAGMRPDKYTFPFVLKACAGLLDLQEGKEIHRQTVRSGIESDVFVGTSLIDMYCKCGSIETARQLFDKMSERNVVSWNAMIAGYAQNGCANEALTLFHQMQQLADVKPDLVTVVSVLPACAYLTALQEGKDIHDYIVKNGFESHLSVRTALVDMYAKCGVVDVAHQLFDKMPKRDVVSWNAMIAGYSQNELASEALGLFYQMQLVGCKPDSVTISSVLPACALLAAVQQGKWIHAYILRNGFESDVSVGNALMDMYAKCGNIEIASKLFAKMFKRDVVSWSSMIAGYVQNGHASEALTLFCQMQMTDVKPDSVILLSVLPACAHLAALQKGKEIHNYIIKSGFEPDISVGTALVDMYSKCGSLEIARQVFEKISQRDVVSWNAMIAAYGMHGHGKNALAVFLKMQQIGVKPDHITFICILSACSHAGLVDEGRHYFDCMSQYFHLIPRMEHYACMVDLLGRSGHLDEAWDFIKKMPLEPDVGVWGALLGACRIHCNVDLGKHASQCLLELEPKNAGNFVLLSNIYAASRSWDDVAKVRTKIKEKGLKKIPGCSWIEVKNRVHEFHAGDRSHPQSEEIYVMLETLMAQMEEAGYAPDTSFVLHDVE